MGLLDGVALKKDNPPPPDWVAKGVRVEHDAFGTGVVREVGLYKRMHTIRVEFDEVGTKALMPMYAMAHMRRVGSE